MTTNRSFLIISAALILLALVTGVSASTVTKEITQLPYSDSERAQAFDYAEGTHSLSYFHVGGNWGGLELHLKQVQNFQNVHYVQCKLPFTTGTEGYHDVWYKRPSDGTFQRGVLQYIHIDGGTLLSFWPANWEVGSKTGAYYTYIYGDNNGQPSSDQLYRNQGNYLPSSNTHTAGDPDYGGYFGLNRYSSPISYSYHLEGYTNNAYAISVTDKMASLQIDLQREFPPDYHYSVITLYDGDDNIILTDSGSNDLSLLVGKNQLAKIRVLIGIDEYIYNLALGSEPTPTPTLPPSLPTSRTGTVTMTDHNGTTIRGFEVRAVNYYTGEEYITSTETDVATITLPMDQTTSMRNPQTGQYEDVPVGYYLFFGEKPGYKMTNEDGIRISVLPEEYQGSYQLCDIIVTSETGYLTGKHQFQIRSRADNSILQTGTISAQSATTGEWYNATVVDGIATLILPYDTSTAQWQYVGNYFVYGSSPGYLDSEYPARVSVRPDTQYEIWSIYLTPIGSVPEPGNVTLRIQAISETGQGIPNAEIFIKGVDGPGWELWETYTTSSTGYAEISVPENSTYDITVSAKGYSSSSQRIEVSTEDPPLLTFMLYLSGWVTPEPTTQPTTQPTGWITPTPTTPPPGIPDEDDDSEGFLMEAIRGISRAFGVGFATGKTIFGMLLALAIGFATAKQLRGGAAEFGLGLLGGTMLGVLIGLLPVWVVVVLLLIVGMYVGYRYVGGSSNG